MLEIPEVTSPRLQRLLRFVQQDPQNQTLLEETLSAALDERHYNIALDLLSEQQEAGLSPVLLNLKGIAALAVQNFDTAIATFEMLRRQDVDAPSLRFNLAWAKAMTGDFAGSNELLDEATIETSSRAPALKIQAMHHLGLYDEALTLGERLAGRYPENAELMGALATLAMDADQANLALHYAVHAGDNPDGQAVLGMLLLDEQDTVAALPLFDQVLARQPSNARAWIGKGLGLLADGDPASGAMALDRGAVLFEDHLGSWIASGWAHFLGNSPDNARASFERALALDANFAESHGGLAVLDVMDGKIESAEQRCKIALRLDRHCLGAALAQVLMLERQGQSVKAQKIRDIAMSLPLGVDGKTLAQTITKMAVGRRN